MDLATNEMSHEVLYSDAAELLAFHEPLSNDAPTDGSQGRRRRSRWAVTGVLFLAIRGTAVGDWPRPDDPMPNLVLGWAPDDKTRFVGVQDFCVPAREIARLQADGCLVQVDLGADGVVDLFVDRVDRFVAAVRASALGARLVEMPVHPGATKNRPPSPLYAFRRQRRDFLASKEIAFRLIFFLVTVLVLAYVTYTRSQPTGYKTKPVPGSPPGYHGPAYPGIITEDQVAGSAGRVARLGIVATAANLRTAQDRYDIPLMCADIVLENRTKDLYLIDLSLWTLEGANDTRTWATNDGTLPPGDLAPGASAKGTVCFWRPAGAGPFVVLWRSSPPTDRGRGVWLFPSAAQPTVPS